MQGKQIRQKLLLGDRIYGTHIINFGNPFSADFMAKQEMDFVFICTEHIPIDRNEVSMMCHSYRTNGISPIVRIPYPNGHLAAMSIDGGAEGIVAPYVETVEEVKELVGAVRYRPIKGQFLKDIVQGNRVPIEKTQQFLDRFNKDKYLIIGIESVEAINNLDKLLSVEGVDGVFLGPHDITVSMEIPEEYSNPIFIETIMDVIKRCRKMGKGVGIHMDSTSDSCKKFIDAGMNFILNSADIIKTSEKLKSEFKMLREQYGDIYQKYGNEDIQIDSCINQTK